MEGTHKDTMLVMRSLKNTERVYKNRTSQKVAEIEKHTPGDIGAIYPYVRGENYRKSFQETGDTQSSVWSCGPVSSAFCFKWFACLGLLVCFCFCVA